MRALHSSALAAAVAFALGGCSRQPPPVPPTPPCIDLKGAPCAVAPDVSHPKSWIPDREDVRMHRRAQRHKRPRHHVENRRAKERHAAPQHPRAALTTPVASEPPTPTARWTPPPAPPAIEQPESRAASAMPVAKSANATVQEQVAVATALAERITALSRLPAPKDQPTAIARNDAASPTTNRLVAVLMVRPNVRAVAELRGRLVAIDERYVSAHDKVSAGMTAAGAADVQLLQGQGTAISRLTSGEVAAAIVALVVPEAADAFPEIAGFRIFRIPLPTS